jgi:DNA polymerase-3 subunit gamma/tau
LSHAVLAGEISTALTQLDELARGGKDLGRLLGDLLNHFRNLLIYQISRGDLNLMETSEAEVAALKEQAPLSNTDALTRILETLADAEMRLRDTASKKILLEVSLLRCIEARNALPIDAILKQLNQLRNQGGAAGTSGSSSAAAAPVRTAVPATPAPVITAAPPAAPQSVAPLAAPTPKPAAPTAATGDLTTLWRNLEDAVGRASPFVRAYLTDAHPVSFEKNILVIGFDPEFADRLSLVDNSRNHTLLATKLSEMGHPNAMIKFVTKEAPMGWERKAVAMAAPAPAVPKAPKTTAPTEAVKAAGTAVAPAAEKKTAPVAFNKDDFKNDPLIQKALEVFKGTIVEVHT